ncbi:hypothetical protein L596_006780 [Steinernema carpocapsae]|uniref:Uncharacterized protein n=1 Tax=Steinernema carpocapsae TaxID=34508 RepID=A0A4U5P7U5_STECR|nr:hypothetical protein L596_006780 [Steinernema carpocapsae]
MKPHRVDFKIALILLSAFCGLIGASTETTVFSDFEEFMVDILMSDKTDEPIDSELQEQYRVDAENVDFWVLTGYIILGGLSLSIVWALTVLYFMGTKKRAVQVQDALMKLEAKFKEQFPSTSETSKNEAKAADMKQPEEVKLAEWTPSATTPVSETQMSGTPTASAASVTGITASATTVATPPPPLPKKKPEAEVQPLPEKKLEDNSKNEKKPEDNDLYENMSIKKRA